MATTTAVEIVIVEFWPEPYAASADRAHLVEAMQ